MARDAWGDPSISGAELAMVGEGKIVMAGLDLHSMQRAGNQRVSGDGRGQRSCEGTHRRRKKGKR